MSRLERSDVHSIVMSVLGEDLVTTGTVDRVCEVSGGHPLALSYLLRRLIELSSAEDIADVLDRSASYAGDIEQEYRVYWDTVSGDTQLVDLLALLCRLRGPAHKELLRSLSDPETLGRFVAGASHFFERETPDRWAFFHNSFRQFLLVETGKDAFGDHDVDLDRSRHRTLAGVADSENEVYVDRDIMVLANPEIGNLPGWVIALVAAGGLAAALSTAAGLLLVISSSVSHDLLKSTFKPDISEKGELMAARIAATAAIVVAGYLGIYPPGWVAQVVAFAFGLAAASLFPAIFMGIFSKSMNKEGAIAGMVSGLAFTFSYIFYFKLVNPEANVAENWLFGISPEGIGVVGMVLNFAIAIAVSKMTASPPVEIKKLVDSIRVPRGAGEAHAH